jgi:hypothetical protein
VVNLLDWRLRRTLRRYDLPDLPEVRAYMRAAWWRGFTFGACPGDRKMAAIRVQARVAMAKARASPEGG